MSITKAFEFFLPTKIIYGLNSREKLPAQLQKMGVSNVLLVTDQVLRGVGVVDKVTCVLDAAEGITYHIYDEVVENPGNSVVDNGYELAKKLGIDALVGLGGGSSLDTATGIAMLMTNGGKALDYFAGKPVENPSLPTVLIPTTSGTGSEVNRCFVVTDEATSFKDGVADDLMCPTVTILDPEMTVSMPPKVTASSGIDAFTHAFEAYLSRGAHPLSDALNLHAMRLIAGNLRKAYADPTDIEARSAMCLASAIAGIGFDQVGLVLAHAMAHPLSGLHHVPHGVACAIVTPPVMEFNVIAVPERIAEVGYILGVPNDPTVDIYTKAYAAVDAFRDLMVQLDLPLTLEELGVSEEDIPKMAEDTFVSGGMRGRNPRVNNIKDIEMLYRSIL